MTRVPIRNAHHVAFSVIDLAQSVEFYKIFGYDLVLQWSAADQSLEIAHLLGPDGLCIELFAYADNSGESAPVLEVGNDLPAVGIKHLGLRVQNLSDVHAALAAIPGTAVTEIKAGRTLIDYFFVRDPNGIWLEIVTDERTLDPSSPEIIQAQE